VEVGFECGHVDSSWRARSARSRIQARGPARGTSGAVLCTSAVKRSISLPAAPNALHRITPRALWTRGRRRVKNIVNYGGGGVDWEILMTSQVEDFLDALY